MTKRLVIAEKPSVGMSIASVLGVTSRKDGYMEGQDYWRLAGIFDDVWVFATPQARIFDWQVITDLDDQYKDANLLVNAYIKNYGVDAPNLKVNAIHLYPLSSLLQVLASNPAYTQTV